MENGLAFWNKDEGFGNKSIAQLGRLFYTIFIKGAGRLADRRFCGRFVRMFTDRIFLRTRTQDQKIQQSSHVCWIYRVDHDLFWQRGTHFAS